MRTVRRVVLLVWAVICGFAAQAVVYALAQLVIDPDATLAWAAAIVVQFATFGLVAAAVYTLKVDGPFVQGRRARRGTEREAVELGDDEQRDLTVGRFTAAVAR